MAGSGMFSRAGFSRAGARYATLNKMPTPTSIASRLEPPELMNGSASPLFGRTLVTTPILMTACYEIKKVTPDASRQPKLSRALSAM